LLGLGSFPSKFLWLARSRANHYVHAKKSCCLEESFSLDKVQTNVIENVAAVPVFVAKPRAKFFTLRKLEKQLLQFEHVRAMEMISDDV
jgi:hypothetical protein